MITAGATPTPKTIDQRRVALTSPQVKTLQTDNAGTLGETQRAGGADDEADDDDQPDPDRGGSQPPQLLVLLRWRWRGGVDLVVRADHGVPPRSCRAFDQASVSYTH